VSERKKRPTESERREREVFVVAENSDQLEKRTKERERAKTKRIESPTQSYREK
jgi:hypothetical protein